LPRWAKSYYTPFVSDSARQVADTMDQFHTTDPRMTDAYRQNGVVYLGAPVAIDDYFLMTTFPVDSLADLTGKKIAAPGATGFRAPVRLVCRGTSPPITTKSRRVSMTARSCSHQPLCRRNCMRLLQTSRVLDWDSGADDAKEWYLSDLEIAVGRVG